MQASSTPNTLEITLREYEARSRRSTLLDPSDMVSLEELLEQSLDERQRDRVIELLSRAA